MRVRELIEKINIKNVPIYYYSFNERNIPRFLVYIDVLRDPKEIELYDSLSNKEDYISNSAALCFPDITLEEIIKFQKKFDPNTYNFKITKITSILGSDLNKESKDLAFLIYLILHEFGHWDDFERMGKKPYLFINQDCEILNALNAKKNIMEKDFRMSKNKTVRNKWIKDYNEVPVEKKANDYAEKHLKIFFDLLSKK